MQISKEDLREFYEERAAIYEYLGKYTREKAEELALKDTKERAKKFGYFSLRENRRNEERGVQG